jgi:fructokinase
VSIIVAGEALIDLAPREDLLLPLPGGSPYNVAIGLGRLGVSTSYLGGLSSDGFGQRLAEQLTVDGVELHLAPVTSAPTTLAVVHLDDSGRASYGFYLDATSAVGLEQDDLPDLPPDAALHVSFGAVTLDTRSTGATLSSLLTAERGRRLLSLDPNVRPSVIADLPDYAARMDELIRGLDLVKVSDEDLLILHPEREPLDVAQRWADAGPALVVVTRGPDGAVAFTADGRQVAVPGRPVTVVDTVGAGDAFTSGLLAWLAGQRFLERGALEAISEAELVAALEQAVRVAAITCTRAGSDPPRTHELDD